MVSLRNFLSKLVGDTNERKLKLMQPLAEAINAQEEAYEALSDTQLGAKTAEFLHRLDGGETLDDILVDAFAAVREASKRTIGLRHYDVQLLGGVALHSGYAVEMKTGEGKTLVATLPLYLNALSRQGAHLVTVNDYLARRDVQWMGPIYHMLRVSVGLLQQGEQQPSFVFDPETHRGDENTDRLRPASRREAYQAHITYGTNSEFGFDYLRDNSAYSLEARVQRGFHYAIVDEVDNILIDEARTPLIISGPANEPTDEYGLLADVVRQLTPEDYTIDERSRSISLTDAGYDRVEQLLGAPLFDPYNPEDASPRQAKLHHHLEQALKAEYIFQRDRDYIIQGSRKSGRVVIVDEFTGRLMPGRRWSDGLHQAIEAKEDMPIRQENITYATITLQNYFRMYDKLAGMTGTAATEAEEFAKIYGLDVLVLPTHRPVVRWDHPDVVLRTQEAKFRAIAQEIVSMHCQGRPVLVGTTSVETSEFLSKRLESGMLRQLAMVTLLRDRLNAQQVDGATYREGMQILNQPLESLSPSALRKLGDQLGVSVSPTSEENLSRLAELSSAGFSTTDVHPRSGQVLARLSGALGRGVPHEVLNARHHTEEARIVARAGEVGAVTIATNMAGRGVDIKLGGELDDTTLAQVNRVLRQNGVSPYDLSFEEMAEALRRLDPDDYFLYQEAVNRFLKHVADEKQVKALGGLHVLGTERHEARRIDNQLRGRSGRQGDPGSSRFYLSLEDDLMRRFGGQRVSDLAARLGAEDDIPIAMGIVSRAIANAQTQVEGYNFDMRKHLLEYDDVLNTQREVVYEQRKRVLSKPDLRDDVWAMVEAEVRQRIDGVFADGPALSRANGFRPSNVEGDQTADMFRLVYYLEHMQPTTTVAGGAFFPSFTLKYVLSTLPAGGSPGQVRKALAETIRQALDSQRRQTYEAAAKVTERASEQIQASVEKLLEAASIAYEGAEMELSEGGHELDPQAAVRVVSQQAGLELDAYALRDLQGRRLEHALMDQVRMRAQIQARMRMLAQVAQRAGVSKLTVEPSPLANADDRTLAAAVLESVDRILAERVEREMAEVEHDIQNRIRDPGDCTSSSLLRFLYDVQYGTHTGFDKGHRKVSRQVERFQFTSWVAEQVAGWDRDRLEKEILAHLGDAIAAWADAWGQLEFQRVGAYPLADLDEETRSGLMRILGLEQSAELAGTRVSDLSEQGTLAVRAYLGERVLFNVQRQLMLEITGHLWVEHLTEIEVLRQGIGLQSYAQKDPLAEYKVRAYEMFQDLLQSIQTQIVAAMFTYRPRDLSQVRVGVDRRKRGPAPVSEPSAGRPEARSRKQRRRRR